MLEYHYLLIKENILQIFLLLEMEIMSIIMSIHNSEEEINKLKQKFSSMHQFFGINFLKLLRKAVFPYEYMDEKWKSKLKDKQLPNIKYFDSTWNNEKCNQNDYDYVQYIFHSFKCRDLGVYNNLYIVTDVLLLGDIFADYRIKSINTYGLDPIYCISSPGYSNRAMLKITQTEDRLITDVNIYLIVKKGIRGDRCELLYINAKANNKYWWRLFLYFCYWY